MGLKVIIVLFASVLAVASSTSLRYFGAEAKPVKTLAVGTRFVTRSVATVLAEQRKVFVASTCGHLTGHAANITILLNNNPGWDPIKGILYFYVVDDPTKTESAALCHNHPVGKDAVPSCLVKSWNSGKDLYVITTAGQVSAVSFTVNVQFISPKLVPNMRGEFISGMRDKDVKFALGTDDFYYLSEIAEISTTQSLTYQTQILLNVTFCANPQTTDNYLIRTTVFGTDGISSYTQHVCNNEDCRINGQHVIGYNGNQLPSNTVDITTQHAQYERLFVLLTCWGGNYEPSVDNYVGRFQYTASMGPK